MEDRGSVNPHLDAVFCMQAGNADSDPLVPRTTMHPSNSPRTKLELQTRNPKYYNLCKSTRLVLTLIYCPTDAGGKKLQEKTHETRWGHSSQASSIGATSSKAQSHAHEASSDVETVFMKNRFSLFLCGRSFKDLEPVVAAIPVAINYKLSEEQKSSRIPAQRHFVGWASLNRR